MSIDYEPGRRRYRVRWREHGSQRSRRFLNRSEAEAFAASLQPAPEPPPAPPPAEADGSGVYVYATTAGPRWRLLYRQSDGTLTTRRGFENRAAAVAARAAAVDAVRRGQLKVLSRATFAESWFKFLQLKRPPGKWTCNDTEQAVSRVDRRCGRADGGRRPALRRVQRPAHGVATQGST